MHSLGRNSKTVMIANIGLTDYIIEETLTILRYTDSSKYIKNFPKIKEEPNDAMIKKYERRNRKI